MYSVSSVSWANPIFTYSLTLSCRELPSALAVEEVGHVLTALPPFPPAPQG